LPQFPKAFCDRSPEASRSRTVRKVLSDYYCIISGECYKYPGAPLDTTQLPGGAGSAPLCARSGCWRGGLEAAAGCEGTSGHNPMGGHEGVPRGMSGLGPSRLHPGAVVKPGAGGMREQEGAGMLQGDASGEEDKGNILRGRNVNRAGAEPLFMESLSCQGICQGPDLRSYLDKGAGGGEQSWRQSHRTRRAAARWALIRRRPRGQGQNRSPRCGAGDGRRAGWLLLGLGCWGLRRSRVTSPPNTQQRPPRHRPAVRAGKLSLGRI